MNSNQGFVERRPTQRFPFTLPVAVCYAQDRRQGSGFTQDLSAKGVFFYSDLPLLQGDAVEITLMMPSEITLAETMRVRCRGKVVRVTQPKDGSSYGAAVRLEGYEFLPEPESLPQGSELPARVSASDDLLDDNAAGMALNTYSMRNASLR